ncbi:MAG: hypothetical protein SPK26_16565 [Treponema sp.]|nr:hypothetical protein [Treponema sp.]
MQKIYSRINWENFPSEKTAVNESNLNRMDLGLDNLDDRVIALDAAKFNTETANTLIKDWVIDEQTGVITITKLNGEKILFDLNIEKIPVNFTLSDDGIITMTTDDGAQFTANIGAMIPILTFEDSDEIAVSVSGEGVNKTYSFSVKNGSITEEKLNPDYLGEIRTQVARAESSATSADASEKNAASSSSLAKSYAVGGTGTRDGEDTDNAKYYMEQAKAVSSVDIATTEKAGIVKPDGTTITADEDGTLHGVAKITVDTALSSTSTNPVQNKVVTSNLTDIRKETTVNLLNPTLRTTTQDGVTCTNNGDGTYTFNGTATKEVIFSFLSTDEQRKSFYENTVGKTFKFLNGGLVNPPVGRFIFTLRDGNKWWTKGEQEDNSIFTVSDGYKEALIDLHIYKNQTVTDLIVKPMLTTDLNATYDDFVPYTGDTGRLNGDVAELKAQSVKKDNVVNNQTTTEAGFALDARQANPNLDGTLAKKISDLNGSLKMIDCGESFFDKADSAINVGNDIFKRVAFHKKFNSNPIVIVSFSDLNANSYLYGVVVDRNHTDTDGFIAASTIKNAEALKYDWYFYWIAIEQ